MKIAIAEDLEELIKDRAMYLQKAEQHGLIAALSLQDHCEANCYTCVGNAKTAVSHAKLAASHARRALSIEEQLNG